MSVLERWRISGKLTTSSLLHVGSGETVVRAGLFEEKTKKPAQVSAVAVDHAGRPYLPGTSLKGVLRAWAAAHGERESVERLFGCGENKDAKTGEEKGGRGGGVIAADAFLVDGSEPAAPPPYWCDHRRTGVMPRVAIDRRHGTASHRRLFYLEVVPAKTSFAVELDGDGLSEEDVVLLLAALAAFDEGAAVLGAHTGDGWGRMIWQPEKVSRLGRDEVVRWLEAGAAGMAIEAAKPLEPEAQSALVTRAQTLRRGQARTGARLAADLELRFDGPFLVRDVDPARAGEGIERPDAVPRRDHQGRPHLPASSFRGALRARAEKILRTLGGDGAACGIDAPRQPCDAVESLEAVAKLCPACRVFGAAGWRAPLAVRDFEGDGVATLRQHFVAVDRFTGGAANKKKFEVESVVSPTLTGRLELDLAALARSACGPWALALLVLTLRDLIEGDVTFGAGAARGYGACRAAIKKLERPAWESWPESLREHLDLGADDVPAALAWPTADSALGAALVRWVTDLESVAVAEDQAWRQHGEKL